MKECNETITIFHHTYNEQTDADVWTPIVVNDVSWFERTDTAITDSGLKSAKKCTIRIPKESIKTGFALSPDDVIIKGTCSDQTCTNPTAIKAKHPSMVTVLGLTDSTHRPHGAQIKVVCE